MSVYCQRCEISYEGGDYKPSMRRFYVDASSVEEADEKIKERARKDLCDSEQLSPEGIHGPYADRDEASRKVSEYERLQTQKVAA